MDAKLTTEGVGGGGGWLGCLLNGVWTGAGVVTGAGAGTGAGPCGGAAGGGAGGTVGAGGTGVPVEPPAEELEADGGVLEVTMVDVINVVNVGLVFQKFGQRFSPFLDGWG